MDSHPSSRFGWRKRLLLRLALWLYEHRCAHGKHWMCKAYKPADERASRYFRGPHIQCRVCGHEEIDVQGAIQARDPSAPQ